MTLQNCLTYTALKQHAMYKADPPMKSNPEGSNAANLAQRGDESEDEWPDDDELQCNLCSDDAPDVVQQLLAVVRKFGKNKISPRPQASTSTTTRAPRCLNCGSPEHKTQDCPKPEVPREERPCFECGKTGHLARDCPNKPQASSKQRPPARNTRRPPARANNLEKSSNQISFFCEKAPPPDHKPSSSSGTSGSHFGSKVCRPVGPCDVGQRSSGSICALQSEDAANIPSGSSPYEEDSVPKCQGLKLQDTVRPCTQSKSNNDCHCYWSSSSKCEPSGVVIVSISRQFGVTTQLFRENP